MEGHNKKWSAGDIVLADDLNKKFAFNINFGGSQDGMYLRAITYDETNNYFYAVRISGYQEISRLKPIGSNNAINKSGNTSSLYWLRLSDYNDLTHTIAQTDDYLYVWARLTADSNYYLVRITKSDKSIVNMTFSGTAPDNDSANILFAYNGDIYIADTSTTTIRKYTISGTTATYDSAITASQAILAGSTLITNGSYWWYVKHGSVKLLEKDNFAGTNQSEEYQNKALRGGGFIYAGVVYGLEFDEQVDETILIAIDII